MFLRYRKQTNPRIKGMVAILRVLAALNVLSFGLQLAMLYLGADLTFWRSFQMAVNLSIAGFIFWWFRFI